MAALKIVKIRLTGKDILAILPLAVFSPVIYFVGETYGIAYTSSSLSGIFMSLIPIFTAGLSYIMLKEGVNKKQIIFILLSVAGVAIISSTSISSGQTQRGLGILCLVLAVVSAAFYAVCYQDIFRLKMVSS